MHKIIFYPVNNGDTCQIILENGRRILLDFRQCPGADAEDSPVIDLSSRLKDELKEVDKQSYDVVAFTHADKDHIEGSTEFFELQHAEIYKGGGRIKIDELWVPAAMVIESATNDEQSNEFVILRQEARYRLKEGKGIKIFSNPPEMKALMKTLELEPGSRDSLFIDAGTIVDTFTLLRDKVEFFCHSPFIKYSEGGGKEIRNAASLIFNIRFEMGSNTFDYFAVGDSEWEVLEEIVSISKYHDNEDRFEWDLLNIPHHCSYLALSDEKGDRETIPKPLVEELLESGRNDAYVISSSKPIPSVSDAYNDIQPPHIQARKCYEKYVKQIGARKFLVTMEEPNANKPEPLSFEIKPEGLSLQRKLMTGAAILTTTKPLRAG